MELPLSKLPRVFLYLSLFLYAVFKAYRLVYGLFIYPFFTSPLRHLPGPKNNTFLLGQAVNDFRAHGPNELHLAWSRRWPNAPFIRYLSFANSEILLVNNLTAHKEILQTKCYDFIKPPFFVRLVGEITGKGLLMAEGEDHKQRRKALAGPFSLPNVKKLFPVFQAKAVELATMIQRDLASDGTGEVEVVTTFEKATLDIIGLTALGVELNNLSSSSSFHKCYHTILAQSLLGQIITGVNMYIPVRTWLPLKANTDFVNANAELRRMLRDLIRQRNKEVEASEKAKTDSEATPKTSRDLLTYIIEEKYISGLTADWSEEDILGHLLNILAAGHETTAGALTWTTHLLSIQPSIQNRLRIEILGMLQQTPTPTYADIENNRYLHNFCREILRVYSPTSFHPRYASKDVIVEGMLIPQGTTLFINPVVAHFHPHIWGANAEEFDPDRWDHLEGDANSPYAFEVFIQGPRKCIGHVFAMMEYKVILIELLRRFELKAVEDKIALDNALTLKPKGGLRIGVRKISS